LKSALGFHQAALRLWSIQLRQIRHHAQRDRKIAQGIKCGGRKTYLERDPDLVKAAKELSAQRPRLSLREIAAELEARGYTNSGKRYPAMSVRNMLLG
jgi:hypothetical protein